jgi:RNA polymerase sigma-70 factor, ECF subfamily
VTDLAWIDAALTSARPQALGALLRYFRDLDLAEEAFQEACLRALRHWPQNGPPREPAAWLIMVGRNVALDQVRRRSKQEALPDEETISDLGDAETELAERLAAVAAMVYLIFNEGYSASGASEVARAPLCDEAIRLARLLLRLFQGEPEIMGLTALLLLQHARAAARFDAEGSIVLLDDQDRGLWDRKMIAEGLALIDKAMRHKRRGPYQVQAAIAALHARAARPEDTDWAQIDLLYGALETLQPSPVVTLNRAVAVSKVRGPDVALAMIEPLAARLSGYFHFFGLKGALLLQLGRAGEARAAFDRAIALANTAAEAAHIRLHLDRLIKNGAPSDDDARASS